ILPACVPIDADRSACGGPVFAVHRRVAGTTCGGGALAGAARLRGSFQFVFRSADSVASPFISAPYWVWADRLNRLADGRGSLLADHVARQTAVLAVSDDSIWIPAAPGCRPLGRSSSE